MPEKGRYMMQESGVWHVLVAAGMPMIGAILSLVEQEVMIGIVHFYD